MFPCVAGQPDYIPIAKFIPADQCSMWVFLFGTVYTGKFKRPRLAEVWGRCICVCGDGPWQGASPSVSQAYRGVRRGPGPCPGAWGRVGYAALPGTIE